MTTMLLVRHGESVANREGFFGGQLDIDLVENGVLQARKAAEYISTHYAPRAVYASDLKRAWQTGAIIADRIGKPLTAQKSLREIYAGQWEGMSFSEIPQKFPLAYKIWREDLGHARCPGGESVSELGERVLKALTDIAEENEGKTVVVATHALPIRAMESIVDSGFAENIKAYPAVSNASVSELTYENGTWCIVQMGIDFYMGDLCTLLPDRI